MSLYFSWHGHICTHSSTLWELLLSGPRAFLLGCPSSPRPCLLRRPPAGGHVAHPQLAQELGQGKSFLHLEHLLSWKSLSKSEFFLL